MYPIHKLEEHYQSYVIKWELHFLTDTMLQKPNVHKAETPKQKRLTM